MVAKRFLLGGSMSWGLFWNINLILPGVFFMIFYEFLRVVGGSGRNGAVFESFRLF